MRTIPNYFEFYIEGGEASVTLVTNVDMIIDGNEVPADTTIYELWLFYNPQSNIYAACGIGLQDLLLLEQGAGAPEGGAPEGLSATAESEALSEPIHNEPNELLTRTSLALRFNEPNFLLVSCPNDNSKPYRLEEFDHYSISEKNLKTPTFPASAGSSYVELQEITTSQFLDPNVTYYVPYPPLLIHGVGGEEIDCGNSF